MTNSLPVCSIASPNAPLSCPPPPPKTRISGSMEMARTELAAGGGRGADALVSPFVLDFVVAATARGRFGRLRTTSSKEGSFQVAVSGCDDSRLERLKKTGSSSVVVDGGLEPIFGFLVRVVVGRSVVDSKPSSWSRA